MPGSQATIQVAVDIVNLNKVAELSDKFKALRDSIIAIQRATNKDADRIAKEERQRRLNDAKIARQNALTEQGNIRATGNLAHKEWQRQRQDRLDDIKIARDAASDERKRLNDAAARRRRNAADRRKEQLRVAAEEKRNDLARLKAEQRLAEVQAKQAAAAKRAEDERAKAMASLKGRLELYEKKLDALFRASYRLKQVGNDVKSFGKNMVTQVTDVIQVFGDFEFMAGRAAGAIGDWAIATDSAGMATSDANDNFRALQDSVLATSESLRFFTAADTAKALYFLASTTGQVVDSQKDLSNMLSSLEPILQTAALTETSYESTIKGVYSILTQYNSELVRFSQTSGDYTRMSEEMRKITIDLFYVAQRTAAEFDDLVNSFKMVGPVAKQSGASFEDILDLIGRLADVGIRGTMAGRALRQMFIQMVRPSAIAAKALDKLFASEENVAEFGGKTYRQLIFPAGKFVGTAKYINVLARALQNATQEEKNYLLARIGTANELPVLQALISQEIAVIKGGGQALSKTADMNTKAEETFRNAWSRLESSWNGTVAALQRGIEALQISVGREFADALKPFVNQIRNVVDSIREWVQANPEIVAQIGKITAVVGALLIGLGTVATAVGSIIGVASALYLAIGAFGPLIASIVTFGGIVAAVISQIIERFDEIQLSFKAFTDEISRAFSDIVAGGKDTESSINSLMEPFKILADAIINGFKTVLDTITAVIRALNDLGMMVPVLKGIAAIIAISFGKSLVNNIFGMVKGLRLFRTETEITYALQQKAAASGAMAWFIVPEQKIIRSGAALRIYDGILQSIKASQIGAALAGSGIVKSFGSVASSIGKVAGMALGPEGMLVAFAAITAYDMNLFGIKDAIDGIFHSTRDLNAELNQTNEELGDMALLTNKTIVNTLLPNYEDAISKIDSLQATTQTIFSKGGPATKEGFYKQNVLQATIFGKQFTEAISAGLTDTGLEDARNKLKQDVQTYYDTVIIDQQKALISFRDGINEKILAAGGEPIDPNELLKKILNFSAANDVAPDLVTKFYEDLITQFGTDFTKEEAQSVAEKYFTKSYAYAVIGLPIATTISGTSAEAVAAAFDDPAAREAAIAGEFKRKRIDAMKVIYDPMKNVLLAALKSGDQKSVARILAQPIGTYIGGTFVATGDSLASLSPELLRDMGLDTVVSDAFAGLDPAIVSGAGLGLLDTGEETPVKIADLVAEKISGDFTLAHDLIMARGDRVVKEFINGIQVFDPTTMLARPASLNEQYQVIANMIVNDKTGETVAQYIAKGGDLSAVLGPELGPVFTTIIEEGVKQGWVTAIYKSDMAAANAYAGKKLGEKIASSKGFGISLPPMALLNASEMASQIGDAERNALKILYPGVNKFAEDTVKAFTLSLQSSTNEGDIRDAYSWLMSQTFNGQTIYDIAKSQQVDATIRDAIKTTLENAVAMGIADPSVLTAFQEAGAEDGAKSLVEYIDSFSAAFDVAKGMKEQLKEALKKGTTQSQLRSMLRTLSSGMLKKALRKSLISRGAALGDISQLVTGIQGGLNATSGRARTNYINTIAKFITVKWNDLPADSKNGLAPIVQQLIDDTDFASKRPKLWAKLAALFPSGGGENVVSTEAAASGTTAATQFISGIVAASNDPKVTEIASTANRNILAAFNDGVDWYANGMTSGQAWADGLAAGMQAFIVSLNVVKDNTEGHSPPKKGPLSKIDKGGEAVGKAYGVSMTRGMSQSLDSGLSGIQKLIAGRQWTTPNSVRTGRSWTSPIKNLIAGRQWTNPYIAGRSWTNPYMLGRQWTNPLKNNSPWLLGRSWTNPYIAGRQWTTPRNIIAGRSWTNPYMTGRQWTNPIRFGRSWTSAPGAAGSFGPSGARTWTSAPGSKSSVVHSSTTKHRGTINLNVNVKSDRNTSPTNLGEIQRGIMTALEASDLEHMLEIL